MMKIEGPLFKTTKPRVLIDVTLTVKSMSYLAYAESPYIPY